MEEAVEKHSSTIPEKSNVTNEQGYLLKYKLIFAQSHN